MPDILGAELILLQLILSLFKGEVLLKRVDKQVSIFSANSAVTQVDWILMKWWGDGKIEANPAAVALASMRRRFGGWSGWKCHIDGDTRVSKIFSVFHKVLKLEYVRLFKLNRTDPFVDLASSFL